MRSSLVLLRRYWPEVAVVLVLLSLNVWAGVLFAAWSVSLLLYGVRCLRLGRVQGVALGREQADAEWQVLL